MLDACADIGFDAMPRGCLRPHGLAAGRGARGEAIPGSYWGEPEAGLIGHDVFARAGHAGALAAARGLPPDGDAA